MTTIYGLRQRGHSEIRYIGRSAKPLEQRLHRHILNSRHNYPPKISQWIRSAGKIEIVAIVECDEADANTAERAVVEAYHAAGHRLTNSHLVPRNSTSPRLPRIGRVGPEATLKLASLPEGAGFCSVASGFLKAGKHAGRVAGLPSPAGWSSTLPVRSISSNVPAVPLFGWRKGGWRPRPPVFSTLAV